MGKMIDAQSIVVASTATRWYGHEGSILRFVFFHSIALACLVGLLVLGQAYVYPLTRLVPPMPAAAAPTTEAVPTPPPAPTGAPTTAPAPAAPAQH